MPNPCISASRFSNEVPSEAECVAEQAARQRDLERELEYQIERQGRGDRSEAREDEGAALVLGERAEHVDCRGEIDPDQWNDADIDGGLDKQHSQPLQFARPQDDFAGVQPSLRQVEYAAAQDDEADD